VTPESSSELAIVDVLDRLAADGYVASFSLDNGLRCPVDGAGPPTVDATFRFEGQSDPDDESIVLALRCPNCHTKGVLVAAYGSMLDGAEATTLAALELTPAPS
jgi:hypothetical protein